MSRLTDLEQPAEPAAATRAAWPGELRALIALAWPLALSQLATVAMSTTDVVMMGWLGPLPLAAGTLASSLIFPCIYFGIGVLTAVAAMCAQELGARRFRGVRRTVRQGFWISALMFVPFFLLIWNGQTVLLLLYQDPEASALAEDYMVSAVWVVFPAFILTVLRNFISAHGRPRAAMIATLVGILVNAAANYVLIFGKFGFPRLELFGAGLATTIVHVFMAAAVLGFVLWDRKFRRYAVLFRLWKSDWPRLLELLRIGIPSGLTLLSEVAMFASASFLIGTLGAAPLAGHAVALQSSAISFMIVLGLSQAATIRVGLAVGRGDRAAIGRVGGAALPLGIATMLPAAYVFWMHGREITGLFLDLHTPGNAEAIGFAVSYLAVAAIFQIADGGQVIAVGLLRGLNDTRMPMLIGFLCYIVMGFSAAVLLSFGFGLGGVGVWMGLALGLGGAAVALSWRFARRERLGLLPIGVA